jgi:hypothetical protein
MWRFCLLLPLSLLSLSCDLSSSRAVATVRGRVTFQSQPLTGGMIVFSPHPDRGYSSLKSASAEIDSRGEFKLQLDGQYYIPAGWYRISIADPPGWTTPMPGKSPQLSAISPFPDALRQPDKSQLEREVRSGRDNEFEFHVEVR